MPRLPSASNLLLQVGFDEGAGLNPALFCCDIVIAGAANAYRASDPLCYKAPMFPDRQTIASRVILDDRSRLPWRFFGRLTTAALAA